MKNATTQETIENAVYRLDKEIAKVTGLPVGSYIDWLEEHVENYRYCYDENDEYHEELIINDLENEVDRFIDFWTEEYGNEEG